MISEGLLFPKDTRTLLRTFKTDNHSIVSLHPDSYSHHGVEFMLSKIFILYLENIDSNVSIKLSVNIDGLLLSSFSKSNLWPILVSL